MAGKHGLAWLKRTPFPVERERTAERGTRVTWVTPRAKQRTNRTNDLARRERSDRLLKILGILAALTAFLSFCLVVLQAPGMIENDHRLVPTFAVARGYFLYYGRSDGPVLSTIYGPITALAYAPALLGRTPMSAIRIATFLNLMFFFVPMLLVARTDAGRGWKTGLTPMLTTFGIIAALVSFSDALNYSAVFVHADAPALGVACLACWIAGRKGPRASIWSAALAGIATAVAVMTKQNLLPLIVALGIWWVLISWRGTLMFAIAFFASSAVIWYVANLFSSSLEAAWFNWFQLPTHQPYSKALLFPVIDVLARQLLLYSLPLAAAVTRQLQSAKAFKSKEAWLNKTNLLLFVGVCLIPSSILGRIKAGGSVNALSPAIYFFALACAVELSGYLQRPPIRDRQRHLAIFASAGLALILGAFVGIKLPEYLYSLAKGSPSFAVESVYRFSQLHPGQVYFPQFPLAVLMAEGRLYNFSWGLKDRREAGYPVSHSQFLEYTPSSATSMAILDWVPDWDRDVSDRCITGRRSTTESALPGFGICSFR